MFGRKARESVSHLGTDKELSVSEDGGPASAVSPARAWRGDKELPVPYSPRKRCGRRWAFRAVQSRAEHVAREQGEEGLMGAEPVAEQKCCPRASE